MKIEVWSDIACPFCYIGKTKLENALASFAEKDEIEVIWKSFQLDPEIENSSLSAIEYLSVRKGIPSPKVLQMMEGVKQMAASEGLTMFPEKAIVANTLNAHRLSHLAFTHHVQNELEGLLFEAHFREGKDISDKKVLLALAVKAGIDIKETEALLNSDLYRSQVEKDIEEGATLGVRGVPFFVFDRKYAISGAQDSRIFIQYIERSFREWKETQKAQL